MKSKNTQFPAVSMVDVLATGTGMRCVVLDIGGREFIAHIHGTDPIAKDAGKVSISRDGKRREKSTNTIGKYDQAVLTIFRNGKTIKCGCWAGQPVEAAPTRGAVVDDGIDW